MGQTCELNLNLNDMQGCSSHLQFSKEQMSRKLETVSHRNSVAPELNGRNQILKHSTIIGSKEKHRKCLKLEIIYQL